MSTTNPYKPIDELDIQNTPKTIEQVFRWLFLLDLKPTLFRDSRDGSYIYLLIKEEAPDLFIEVDSEEKFLLIYSNVLTELKDLTIEKSNQFMLEIMTLQSHYPKVRMIALEMENLPVKLFSRYRMSTMTMEQFSELIREKLAFIEEIQEIIVAHQLAEVWREAEGEMLDDEAFPDEKKYHYDYY